MRRSVMLLGVAVVCLSIASPLTAGNGAALSPASPSCPDMSFAEPAAEAVDGDLLVAPLDPEVGKDLATPEAGQVEAASSPLPECPTLRDCPLGNSCKGTNPCQLVGPKVKNDTGHQACDDGGKIVVCPKGQTIHTVTAACGQCPCCSTFPACFCPLDCGTAVLAWGCA